MFEKWSRGQPKIGLGQSLVFGCQLPQGQSRISQTWSYENPWRSCLLQWKYRWRQFSQDCLSYCQKDTMNSYCTMYISHVENTQDFSLNHEISTTYVINLFWNDADRYQCCQFCQLKAHPLSICTRFLKYLFHQIDFWTWFFVYFKLDFYCLCKNPVGNRQKIKFKNQVQKSISKIKCR